MKRVYLLILKHEQMEQPFQYFDINRLKGLFPGEFIAGIDNDFFIADFRYDRTLKMFRYPCRFDGYMVIFCLKGNFCLDINLKEFEVSENSLVINIPGNIIRVSDIKKDGLSNFRFLMIAVSKEFIQSTRIDFNKLFNESMSVLEDPCIKLKGDSLRICGKYLDLATDLLTSDLPSKKESTASMLSSILYLLGSIWSKNLSSAKESTTANSARSKMVLDHFLRLVTEYHSTERNVAFYASKLGPTPKYLSKFIKNVSGRSAPEWIDAFVILEAKNLLKYSDTSIKQIVYKLNFSNQSVFYKFFKSHTGMTPSEYRES